MNVGRQPLHCKNFLYITHFVHGILIHYMIDSHELKQQFLKHLFFVSKCIWYFLMLLLKLLVSMVNMEIKMFVNMVIKMLVNMLDLKPKMLVKGVAQLILSGIVLIG